jgi:ADP-ribose pyrophosphatase YjhB (NUDIX family)
MIWTPRVTVAAVIQRENRFLLVEEEVNGHAVFNQPAGHLEAGESLVEAAVRETLEETAWRFIPSAITGVYRWPHPDNGITFLRFCFTGTVSDHDPARPLDAGILGCHWLTREELLTRPQRSPMVLRCVDDYLAGRRYPLSLCHDILTP